MKIRKLAMCAAVLSLANPGIVHAQDAKKCMAPAQAEALVTYLLPKAVEASRTKCADHLPADAVLLLENSEQLAKYKAASEAAWPEAKMAVATIAGDKLPDNIDDELLKPMAGLFIGAMISSEIKPKSCGTINKIYTALEPMPSANLANLFVVILQESTKDDKDQKLPICQSEGE